MSYIFYQGDHHNMENQTIAYYNQNAASFIQGTVSVDSDDAGLNFNALREESAGFRVWFRKRHEVFSGKRSCCYGDGRFRRTVQIRQCLYRYSGKKHDISGFGGDESI